MNLDWEHLVKRYVWDDTRTPYFTRVAHLSATQVHYEVLAYALFMGVLFGVLALATLSERLPHGAQPVVPLYAFSVACAALVLGMTRQRLAALWCAQAPLGVLVYFALYGFHPNLDEGGRVVLVALVSVLAAYGLRVMAIVRAAR